MVYDPTVRGKSETAAHPVSKTTNKASAKIEAAGHFISTLDQLESTPLSKSLFSGRVSCSKQIFDP
jgi:hypothetical protein